MTRCKSARNDVYVTEQLFRFHPYIVDDRNVCVRAANDFLRYVSLIYVRLNRDCFWENYKVCPNAYHEFQRGNKDLHACSKLVILHALWEICGKETRL